MAESFNPTSDKRQAWALSELKETYIEVFQKFIEARFKWMQAIAGIEDPHTTKIDYVCALDAYYQVSQAVFDTHLRELFKDDKEGLERMRDMFRMVGFKGLEMKDEALYQMGNYINEWNTKDGFMRLNENVQSFKSPIEAVKYFEMIR